MIRIGTELTTLRKAKGDLLVSFVLEDSEHFRRQVEGLEAVLGRTAGLLGKPRFEGKEKQTLLLYPSGIASRQLLLVGLGKAGKMSLETLRRASAAAAKVARDVNARSFVILEPEAPGDINFGWPGNVYEGMGMALAEGVGLGMYRYNKYLTTKPDAPVDPDRCNIGASNRDRLRHFTKGVGLARIVCEATCAARDLSNAPGNEIYPQTLAAHARSTGRRHGFRVTVFNESTIAKLGMGGLLGVARGSANPPRFIVMEYNRKSAGRGTIVLVGKGVTFDSGGISIKPSENMSEMKMDMAGAAAVIGTLQAAAALKIPVHLVGLIPATENLPGGRALKPGDILRHHNGTTSEVDNTDAEGRLILADALSYAHRYKPDAVIDLATLTGAVVVALGHIATGMLGNDRKIMDRLVDSGNRTFERVWELPMFEEYEQLVKSDIADVKNVGGRWAGAITGAMFLKKFIGDCPWVHLDIAGTAILEEPLDYTPKGGSGVGVRLLVDFLRHWTKS